jgi:hypothetical protein
MNIFVVLVALLTLCNLATFLLSLPSNLMAETVLPDWGFFPQNWGFLERWGKFWGV